MDVQKVLDDIPKIRASLDELADRKFWESVTVIREEFAAWLSELGE